MIMSGDEKTSRIVKLVFPGELIKEPVTFNMAIKYQIVPNIRRARVTETVGELVLELKGDAASIEQGISYLKEKGVKVDPIEGDVID
jgi:ABC-type methionine transport system ATPase subunit